MALDMINKLMSSQQNAYREKSEEKVNTQKMLVQKSTRPASTHKLKIVWKNAILFALIHLGWFYGLHIFFNGTKFYTILWSIFWGSWAGLGITAGAHRLWAHRSYKAKWPMRLILTIGQTIAFQNHIYEWVRDHRVHHKFTETDADPHNALRGFFFSHMGWLMVRKHPDVKKKGATVDMSDLEEDLFVVWQRRYYWILMPVCCFVIPLLIPWYFWDEKLSNAWFTNFFRFMTLLNITWLVNSAAHIWGMKPYDKTIGPTENLGVAIFSLGEGWHNYHHVFPWDYKAAELSNYRANFTTAFIDLCARIGWAYDMKTVPPEVVLKRVGRTGDGSFCNIAPNVEGSHRDVQEEKSAGEVNTQKLLLEKPASKYTWNIVWRNVIIFVFLHLGALYGVYLAIFGEPWLYTWLWSIFWGSWAGIGITAGAHRLWAHRSYKAKWPMRLILTIGQTIAFQNHIYEWVRDHRVHHKFTETDADPHNALRGFFFSHMGWLMVRKHPDVKKKGATVDMSDLEKDPFVVWQRRFYLLLVSLFSFIIPILVPWYFWNEKLLNAFYSNILRYVITLHSTWLVNSAAHLWGMKPYDKTIGPTENISVAIVAFGEGWHNYHHVFPWDYKAAELGNYRVNFATGFIDVCARLGWAYDLKTVSAKVVMKRASRTGDGSIYTQQKAHHHSHEDAKWGWGDKDMQPEEIQEVDVINKTAKLHLDDFKRIFR